MRAIAAYLMALQPLLAEAAGSRRTLLECLAGDGAADAAAEATRARAARDRLAETTAPAGCALVNAAAARVLDLNASAWRALASGSGSSQVGEARRFVAAGRRAAEEFRAEYGRTVADLNRALGEGGAQDLMSTLARTDRESDPAPVVAARPAGTDEQPNPSAPPPIAHPTRAPAAFLPAPVTPVLAPVAEGAAEALQRARDAIEAARAAVRVGRRVHPPPAPVRAWLERVDRLLAAASAFADARARALPRERL